MNRFTTAIIAIFIISFSYYDVNNMVLKYGENMDVWKSSANIAFYIDFIIFLYGWYKLFNLLKNDKSN